MDISAKNKKALLEFEKHKAWVKRATSKPKKKESLREKRERIKTLLGDYDLFANYYLKHYLKNGNADFHIESCNEFIDNPQKVTLFQWFREGGKSIHMGLGVPLYLYYKDELTGMITGSANEKLAKRLLIPLQAEFEDNELLINDFGDQRIFGHWSEGDFVTKKDVQFLAFGRKQTPRGVRFKYNRPNYGILDDLNTRERLNNDTLSDDDYLWSKEDFLGALDTNKWWLGVPQNKFHENTLTAKFENDKEIDTYVSKVNILNDEGESNFPAYISTKAANAKIKAMGYASSQRELFNNPVKEGKTFKREWLTFKELELLKTKYDAIVSYCDPSYKSTETSDYKAWICVGKKGIEYHVFKVFVEKTTINNMFRFGYNLEKYINKVFEKEIVINHWMEANFLQDRHFKTLRLLAKTVGRMLRVKPDKRKKPNKKERIEDLQSLFQFGLIIFDKSQEGDVGMIRLIQQLLAFSKDSNAHDDAPDALEGAIYILDNLTQESGTLSSWKKKVKSKLNWG